MFWTDSSVFHFLFGRQIYNTNLKIQGVVKIYKTDSNNVIIFSYKEKRYISEVTRIMIRIFLRSKREILRYLI